MHGRTAGKRNRSRTAGAVASATGAPLAPAVCGSAGDTGAGVLRPLGALACVNGRTPPSPPNERPYVPPKPAALERGVSVVGGGAFNSGLLADPGPGATYDYAAAPAGLLERALRMRDVAERHGTTLRAAALAFCRAHPAVASVLVGARSADEVADCAEQFEAKVPDGFWAELRARGLGETP